MIRIIALTLALIGATICSGSPVSAVFPVKNGCSSMDIVANLLPVDGAQQVSSWLAFNTRDFDTKNLGSAILLLPVKSIRTTGLCGVHALMAPVSAQEGTVRERDLHYDDIPIVSANIDSSFTDGMLLLNITDQVRAHAFFGILIRSMGTLSASFCARTASPSPAVVCVREIADAAGASASARWFAGRDRPDSSLGRQGDFYAQPVRSIVYRKSAVSWDSVMTLTPPPAKAPVVAAKSRKSAAKSNRKPVKKVKQIAKGN